MRAWVVAMVLGGAGEAMAQDAARSRDDLQVCQDAWIPPGPRLTDRTELPVPHGPDDGRCPVQITLDDAGVPTVAFDAACPATWVQAWSAPLAAWRWLAPQPIDPRDGHLVLTVSDDGCPGRTLENASRITFPTDLTGQGREAHCRFVLTVADKGEVTAVRPFGDCPEAFAEAAVEQLGDWRYTRNADPGEVAVQLHFMEDRVYYGALPPPVGVFEDEAGDRIDLRRRRALDPALRRGLTERVTCKLVARVDPTGEVKAVHVDGCPKGVSRGLRQVARSWRFSPPQSGDTVDVVLRLPVDPLPGAPKVVAADTTVPRLAHQVAPAAPKQADLYAGERIVCTADVTLDSRGRPAALSVDGCPPPFVDATERAVRKWRWDGEGLQGHTTRVEVAFGR